MKAHTTWIMVISLSGAGAVSAQFPHFLGSNAFWLMDETVFCPHNIHGSTPILVCSIPLISRTRLCRKTINRVPVQERKKFSKEEKVRIVRVAAEQGVKTTSRLACTPWWLPMAAKNMQHA
ncbi:MAG: hypothetical protein JSS84_10360 [Bacteroidetes bacterium]|nr:hypothetical protein [Bacteroidota bacterium]